MAAGHAQGAVSPGATTADTCGLSSETDDSLDSDEDGASFLGESPIPSPKSAALFPVEFRSGGGAGCSGGPPCPTLVRLWRKRARLRKKEAHLRAKICYLRRQTSGRFSSWVETVLKEMCRARRVLEARKETLEAEQVDLNRRSKQLDGEHGQTHERLKEKNAEYGETEHRIQRLMDRLVTLLSANSSATTMQVQFSEVLEELKDSEQRLVRQLSSLTSQLETARAENRRAALLLSEEQRRTKRLHDTLCTLQAELFSRHEEPGGARAREAMRSWKPPLAAAREAAHRAGAEAEAAANAGAAAAAAAAAAGAGPAASAVNSASAAASAAAAAAVAAATARSSGRSASNAGSSAGVASTGGLNGVAAPGDSAAGSGGGGSDMVTNTPTSSMGLSCGATSVPGAADGGAGCASRGAAPESGAGGVSTAVPAAVEQPLHALQQLATAPPPPAALVAPLPPQPLQPSPQSQQPLPQRMETHVPPRVPPIALPPRQPAGHPSEAPIELVEEKLQHFQPVKKESPPAPCDIAAGEPIGHALQQGPRPGAAPDAGAGPHVNGPIDAMSGSSIQSAIAQATAESTSASLACAAATPSVTLPTPGSPDRPSRGLIAEEATARLRTMEQRLKQVLEAVSFQDTVTRLGNSYYEFGPVRASIRLHADSKVYASMNETDYEPIETFISRISARWGGSSPEEAEIVNADSALPADDPSAGVAAAAKAMCHNSMDPSWTLLPPSRGAAGSAGAAGRLTGMPEFSGNGVPLAPTVPSTATKGATPMVEGKGAPEGRPAATRSARAVGIVSEDKRRGATGCSPPRSAGERRDGRSRTPGVSANGGTHAAQVGTMGAPPRRSWSPSPPGPGRARSPRKVHAGDDAAGHSASGDHTPGRDRGAGNSAVAVPSATRGGDAAGWVSRLSRVDRRIGGATGQCGGAGNAGSGAGSGSGRQLLQQVPGVSATIAGTSATVAAAALSRSPPRRVVGEEGTVSRDSLSSASAGGGGGSSGLISVLSCNGSGNYGTTSATLGGAQASASGAGTSGGHAGNAASLSGGGSVEGAGSVSAPLPGTGPSPTSGTRSPVPTRPGGAGHSQGVSSRAASPRSVTPRAVTPRAATPRATAGTPRAGTPRGCPQWRPTSSASTASTPASSTTAMPSTSVSASAVPSRLVPPCGPALPANHSGGQLITPSSPPRGAMVRERGSATATWPSPPRNAPAPGAQGAVCAAGGRCAGGPPAMAAWHHLVPASTADANGLANRGSSASPERRHQTSPGGPGANATALTASASLGSPPPMPSQWR